MRRRRRSISAAVLALSIVSLSLAGCGRRGGLEPAPDPTVTAQPADTTLQTGLRRQKAVPIVKPKDSFILDPLL